MLHRIATALVAIFLISSLMVVVADPPSPAGGAEGLIGAVGCSQTRDIYGGIELIGAVGFWPAAALADYGGGSIKAWSNLSSDYWNEFATGLAEHPETTDVWLELCVTARPSPVAGAGDLAAGETIVAEIKALAPDVTVHVSAMNDYEGIVCTFIGTEAPAVSRDVAAHLVEQGLAEEGPVVGPLTADTVGTDGCHANEAGMILQAEQLAAYFSGTGTPPPTTPPADLPFTDISTSVFVDDIVWLAEQGITTGCNPPANDQYCPDLAVSRDQMATFLARALNLPEGGPDLFDDDTGSQHEAAINAIGAAGITMGCNPPLNDQYCPTEDVSRAQMASFLVRGYDLPDAPGDLFGDDTGSIHEADINALGASGITSGCNPPFNDLYCPNLIVSRGQMAAFLHRAADLGG